MKPIKIIHLSTSNKGGAFTAAYNLHKICIKYGYNSDFYCKYSSEFSHVVKFDNVLIQSNFYSIFHRIKIFLRDNFPFLISNYFKGNKSKILDKYSFYQFSETRKTGINLSLVKSITDVDVLLVHWVTGFVNYYDFYNIWRKFNCKVIFTMMDMAPITGGCHYSNECLKFHQTCSNCPALEGQLNIAENQLNIKVILSKLIKPSILTFSLQNLQDAKNSAVYFDNYYYLNLPYDKHLFNPQSKSVKNTNVYNVLGSAFTSFNSRKGPQYFLETLIQLDRLLSRDVVIKVFHINLDFESQYKFDHIIFEKFNFINEPNELAKFYSQMDLLVFTSIADAAPMMMAECLLCGIPVVSFDTGNARHIIKNGVDGFVVPLYDSKSLAEASYSSLFEKPSNWATPLERHKRIAKIHDNEKFETEFINILKQSK